MKHDLSLCLVTDSTLCGERGVIDTVSAAIQGGVSVVQLRNKHASVRDLAELAFALLGVLKGTGIPLIINDRLDVALATGADGVHLGQCDLDVRSARKIAGSDFLIGLTVSRAEEIATANSFPSGTLNYLGVGPIFHTSTKENALDPIGLDVVARLHSSTQLPCIGIGGISTDNASAAWSTGLEGLAVVSAICSATDPKAAAEAIRSARN